MIDALPEDKTPILLKFLESLLAPAAEARGRAYLSRKSSFTVGKGGWFYMSEDKWEAAGKKVEATGKKIQQVGARSHF